MRLTNLADVCRKAGLTVVEVQGWQTRGRPWPSTPKSIVAHHTAGASAARNGKDYPSLGVVRDGRRDLPGPLAQIGLGRNGTVYVIASGRANHAGRTNDQRFGNAKSIGIEAENSGNEPWPLAQYAAYALLCKALCVAYGIPVDLVRGHKEICWPRGRKPDPSFTMPEFRTAITNAQAGLPQPPERQGDDDMIRQGDKGAEVKKLQRTINGILYRSKELGWPEEPEITLDGHFGPNTTKAYAHAIGRAQKFLGIDWTVDVELGQVSPFDQALLLRCVIDMGKALEARQG